MQKLNLKPNHKPVLAYYDALGQFNRIGISHETAVRSAFQSLLESCCRQFSWTLVPEWEFKRPKQRPVRVDGALVDAFRLAHGYWEAKDERDDLEKEVEWGSHFNDIKMIYSSPLKRLKRNQIGGEECIYAKPYISWVRESKLWCLPFINRTSRISFL